MKVICIPIARGYATLSVMLYRALFSSLLYVVHTQPTSCSSTQSLIMSGAREIKFGVFLAKAPFNMTTLFTGKFDLNFRKKLVKCYVWSLAWCGAKTRTLLEIYHKSFKVMKCGAGGQFDRSHKK